MAEFVVRFHPNALEESEAAARAFVDELSHAIRMITLSPTRWP